MVPTRVNRKEGNLKGKRHESYGHKGKWPEPTVCRTCGAVYAAGRWTWKKSTGKPHSEICPACRRTAENNPAGHVQLSGPFFNEHRTEILQLVGHVEQMEKKQRPLERILRIREDRNATLVTTTGVHVARRIGESLGRAYKGTLTIQYPEAELSVRVVWER